MSTQKKTERKSPIYLDDDMDIENKKFVKTKDNKYKLTYFSSNIEARNQVTELYYTDDDTKIAAIVCMKLYNMK